MVDDNSKNSPRQGGASWWKPGVEIFSQVSGWIAGPIILALVLGKYLDGRFETKPWIFLGLTGFAFFISSFGIVKVVSRYMKKIQDEEKNKKDL
jgi:F0F1-type ATP synthase assembly protein I